MIDSVWDLTLLIIVSAVAIVFVCVAVAVCVQTILKERAKAVRRDDE